MWTSTHTLIIPAQLPRHWTFLTWYNAKEFNEIKQKKQQKCVFLLSVQRIVRNIWSRTMQLLWAQPSLKVRKCQGHTLSMLSVWEREISIAMYPRRCKYTLSTPNASAQTQTQTHTEFILHFLCVRCIPVWLPEPPSSHILSFSCSAFRLAFHTSLSFIQILICFKMHDLCMSIVSPSWTKVLQCVTTVIHNYFLHLLGSRY